MNTVLKALRWALGEVWEKVNVLGTWRSLRDAGRKYGVRFLIAAVIWELIEDVLFPILSWWAGAPQLIPVFLIFHFEIITWPIFFWAFRTYDRLKGREPWEPERPAMSSHLRSAVKVGVYQTAVAGWVWAFLLNCQANCEPKNFVAAGVFVGLMSLFGFIHERIWHDSNYGIQTNDTVGFRRLLAKTATYCGVSFFVLYSVLRAAYETVPWGNLITYQTVATVSYFVLESVWAKSVWGITLCPGTQYVRNPDGSWVLDS